MTQLDYLAALIAVQRIQERLDGAFPPHGGPRRPAVRPIGSRPHARSRDTR